ncbi:hypothetical protein PCE1_001282 [Barthelona sp. PCE]
MSKATDLENKHAQISQLDVNLSVEFLPEQSSKSPLLSPMFQQYQEAKTPQTMESVQLIDDVISAPLVPKTDLLAKSIKRGQVVAQDEKFLKLLKNSVYSTKLMDRVEGLRKKTKKLYHSLNLELEVQNLNIQASHHSFLFEVCDRKTNEELQEYNNFIESFDATRKEFLEKFDEKQRKYNEYVINSRGKFVKKLKKVKKICPTPVFKNSNILLGHFTNET